MAIRNNLESAYEPITESGCWIWMRALSSSGYGTLQVDGKTVLAHRHMYETCAGTIPEGMHVLHKCDIRCCVNPAHLFLGTNADNVADRVAKGRQSPLQGEQHGNAKLTEAQVISIREDHRTLRVIGEEYGVTLSNVFLIRHRAAWGHIPDKARG